jgi:hypothetical protein
MIPAAAPIWAMTAIGIRAHNCMAIVRLTKMAGALAILIALSGCANHPWEPDIDRTAYACQEYGFYPGTPEYDNCLKYVDTRRAKRVGF